jgi:predicted nuclease with TOPRIM domain
MPANGMNTQLVDLTININGQDRVVPGLPVSLEVAGRDPEIYTGNRETAERVIDEKMAEADKMLQSIPHFQKVKQDGPACKETINPGYAQTRKQAETIENLKAELAATKGELQGMKDMQARTLELLERLSSGTEKKKKDS